MNADELLKVSEGLCWVTARLGDMPEEKQEALAAMAACTMANLVVVELAHHLAHGVEPYEVCGELQLALSQSTKAPQR